MHNALLRHRGNRAAALFASAVAIGLAAAGCGGSTVRTTTSRPDSGSAGSAGSGSNAAIVNRCAGRANGDPATLGLCLASHGVVVPSHGRVVSCVQAANTRAEVTDCVVKAAQ